MFEQALLADSTQPRSRWSLLFSGSMQAVVLCGVLLLSVLHTDRLPPLQPLLILPPLPKAAPAEAPQQPATVPARHHDSVVQPSWSPLPRPQAHPLVPSLEPGPAPELVASGSHTTEALLGHQNGVISSIGTGELRPAPPLPAEKPIARVPAAPIRVSLGVQEAKLLRRVMPMYPALAKQARIQGSVVLVGVIGKDGRIQQLQLLSGHPLLSAAAIDAVRQWVYKPTLLSGEPVEVVAPIEVRFRLGE